MESKIEQIAELEAEEFSRLYTELLPGFIGIVFSKANVPRKNPIPKSYFDALKIGFCNSMFGGCEPEFETEKQFLNWEKMHETHKYMTESEVKEEFTHWNGFFNSPYQDKTLPYIVKFK